MKKTILYGFCGICGHEKSHTDICICWEFINDKVVRTKNGKVRWQILINPLKKPWATKVDM